MKQYTIMMLFLMVYTFSAWADGVDLERIYSLRGTWKFSIGDDKKWSDPGYNHESWANIYAPGKWENEGYYGYDGYAWYRTTFDGSEVEPYQNIYVMLGYIDDVDEVFINGHLIGKSGSFPPHYSTAFNAKRIYFVPREILKNKGKNLIAVRVYDEGGEGGIVDGRIGLYTAEDEFEPAVNLQGMWKFKPGNNPQWKNKYWNDEGWMDIITPSLWRNVGLWDLDGFAWYRKSFFLDKKYKDMELYIVLGKIDDFDKTYINGTLVGETADHKQYGWSNSYTKLRLYRLPENELLFGGYNTVAVRIYDIGDKGGIYEGPVGIITRNQMQKIRYY